MGKKTQKEKNENQRSYFYLIVDFEKFHLT